MPSGVYRFPKPEKIKPDVFPGGFDWVGSVISSANLQLKSYYILISNLDLAKFKAIWGENRIENPIRNVMWLYMSSTNFF